MEINLNFIFNSVFSYLYKNYFLTIFEALFVLIIFSSCNHKNKSEEIEEVVIIGDSGFLLKDNNGKSYPSTYWIDCDTCKTEDLKYDTTKLDIRQYFEYKKGGRIKVAIRRFKNETEYYYLSAEEKFLFEKLIDSVLISENYKESYRNTGLIIYDGWNYTLYYKFTSGKKKIINYIPNYLPNKLKVFHDTVKSISYGNLVASQRFEYHQVVYNNAIKKFVNNPPPVLPVKEQIKFPRIRNQ